jgi:hypothetical protein
MFYLSVCLRKRSELNFINYTYLLDFLSLFGINKLRDISARLSYGCVLNYVRINLFLGFLVLYAHFQLS